MFPAFVSSFNNSSDLDRRHHLTYLWGETGDITTKLQKMVSSLVHVIINKHTKLSNDDPIFHLQCPFLVIHLKDKQS